MFNPSKKPHPENKSSFSLRKGEVTHFNFQFAKIFPPTPFILEEKNNFPFAFLTAFSWLGLRILKIADAEIGH